MPVSLAHLFHDFMSILFLSIYYFTLCQYQSCPFITWLVCPHQSCQCITWSFCASQSWLVCPQCITWSFCASKSCLVCPCQYCPFNIWPLFHFVNKLTLCVKNYVFQFHLMKPLFCVSVCDIVYLPGNDLQCSVCPQFQYHQAVAAAVSYLSLHCAGGGGIFQHVW